MVNVSYDYIVKSPPKVSHHTNKFGGHRLCGSRDIIALVCHGISSKGHVTLLMVAPHEKSPPSQAWWGHRHCGSIDKVFWSLNGKQDFP